jgi:bifunctional UDP-N-acetylglucosamine pyrophosphorylase/glucosamine-1-phosphate N-acetyltransferase
LANAEEVFQNAKRTEMLENGVTLLDPNSTFFSYDTYLGRDALVEQNVIFGPGVSVETGARIRAFSHLEGAHVGSGAIVGPYARLRPGTELSNKVRIGNFVETKNARIGEGSKVNHLSYIGDTEMGDDVNVGAGTVTCNYDGTFKHQTKIGDRVFIGSDTMLIAPVTLGNDSMTASGSVITHDVPDSALAIARQRQENKSGLAAKIRERLKTMKQNAIKGS